MISFDTPSREFCVARRIRTNTPLQALVTLNDRAYHEAAQAMAQRMVRQGGLEPEDRIRYGFKLVQTRTPDRADVEEMAGLFEEAREQFHADPEAALQVAENPELAALTVVAGALLNLDATLTKE
jgi:hypothetical protein